MRPHGNTAAIGGEVLELHRHRTVQCCLGICDGVGQTLQDVAMFRGECRMDGPTSGFVLGIEVCLAFDRYPDELNVALTETCVERSVAELLRVVDIHLRIEREDSDAHLCALAQPRPLPGCSLGCWRRAAI
jgi:hypothetical protein